MSRLGFVVACVVACLLHGPGARAQGTLAAPRITGLAPDLQLVGGGGIGVEHALRNNFLGRLRLGALYAYEPHAVSLGATAELGGLAELGAGGELEWNHWGGFFGQLGAAWVDGGELMSHVAAGFMVFQVEWQHRFTSRAGRDAVMFAVRAPLGLWWLLVGRDEQQESVKAARGRLAAEPGPAAARPAPVDPGASLGAQQALSEARVAAEKGEHALAAQAYRRAYALEPDPMILPRLADAEQRAGRLVAAARALRDFLAAAGEGPASSQKQAVQARLHALLPQLAHLRLSLTGAQGDEAIEVDGLAQPQALLGYDVELDAGSHRLIVRRAGIVVAEQTFVVAQGELLRLPVSLPAAAP